MARNPSLIFHALFSNLLNLQDLILGDEDFKSDRWMLENPDNTGWTSYPPDMDTVY